MRGDYTAEGMKRRGQKIGMPVMDSETYFLLFRQSLVIWIFLQVWTPGIVM